MNKRGQVVIYLLMLGIVVIILMLALAPTIKYQIEGVRNTTFEGQSGLDCSNSSISDYQKGQCMVVDLTMPYWFFIGVGIAGAVLVARLYLGGSQ